VRNHRQQQQRSLSRRRQVWNFVVEKLSSKTTAEPTIDEYDMPVDLSKPIEWRKHKFMDGNRRQQLTQEAWKHADKE
jgi:hypothetical protein